MPFKNDPSLSYTQSASSISGKAPSRADCFTLYIIIITAAQRATKAADTVMFLVKNHMTKASEAASIRKAAAEADAERGISVLRVLRR